MRKTEGKYGKIWKKYEINKGKTKGPGIPKNSFKKKEKFRGKSGKILLGWVGINKS